MLKIYNSLSRKIEIFEPINKNKVNMYVCGATTYNDIHIGNARPIIFFEVVRKYLSFLGYSVKYVSNYTDIDDKIINKSKELNITEKDLTDKYIEALREVTTKLIGKLPDETPRATEYINTMGKYIEKLIGLGYAYQNETGVYFRVGKIKDYGILSNQEIDNLDEGARIEIDEKKENPKDFNLWKFTKTGITFESPFGKGRPGWHTECVVMNDEIFGTELDIHGGGADLKFPHHENEIAQSMAINHHHLSKYWMHVGLLTMDGGKMSKSIGNVILMKDLVNNNNPKAFIQLLLSAGYRQPVNYSDDLMVQFSNDYDKMERTIKKALFILEYNKISSKSVSDEYIFAFKKEMNNDFNTANALSVCYQVVKEINKEKNLDLLATFYNTLMAMLDVLCLAPSIKVDKHDIATYDKWCEARNSKDYEKADVYRNDLAKKGWI